MDDLFSGCDVDVEPEAVPVEYVESVEALTVDDSHGPQVVSGLSPVFRASRISLDSVDPDLWFSICVLTVPDTDRFPLPARFCQDKQAVDLTGLDDLAWGDVRKLIGPSLPDEQLEEIDARERVRPKPRAKVLEAVVAERATRGDGYRDWIVETGRNPLTCRIAAIAWQAGGAAEVVSVAPADSVTESAALHECVAAWVAFCTDSGFDRLAGWDLYFAMRVVTARRAALGSISSMSDFRPCLPVFGRDWVDLVAQSGGLALGALSLGIAACDIPQIADPMTIFRTYKASPGDVQLSDLVGGQLILEREMLMVTQGMW